MKIIRYINAFAVLLPITLGLSGFLYNDMWFWALWSTMLTGFLQVVIAVTAAIMNHNRKMLYVYLAGVAIYFSFMYFNNEGYYLYYTPIILATYLTFVIHKNKTNEP